MSSDIIKGNQSTSNQKVLLVEDNNINRKIIGLLLKGMNYQVVEAINGYEAIEFSKNEPYAFILMDIVMPGIDGYETSKIIRTLDGPNKLVPIIALTANNVDKISVEVKNSGISGALEKPLRKDELKNMIDEIIHPNQLNTKYIFNKSQFEKEYEDIQLRKDIIKTFIDDKDKDLDRIKYSFQTKDIDTIYATLHYLKGSFTYLKADKILNATVLIMVKCKQKSDKEVFQYEASLTECYNQLVILLTEYYNSI